MTAGRNSNCPVLTFSCGRYKAMDSIFPLVSVAVAAAPPFLAFLVLVVVVVVMVSELANNSN